MTEKINREQRILAEIIQRAKELSPEKRENEFSRYEFAKMVGCGKEFASRMLDDEIKAGRVKSRVTSVGTTYYSVIIPENMEA